VILVLVFAAIYWLTLDTGLQPYELHGGDLITHQYAQVEARPGNAPGYPLYTMGGWLWFHGWRALLSVLGQPYPNPLPILSSYSTLWALIALWLLYATLGHLLGKVKSPPLATVFCWLTSAFLGVTYFFWYYATTTEQYSSAIAQTVAIFYLYLLWDLEPLRRHLLYWLALLCGVSLAHMLTVAFIVPPLVVAVLWRNRLLLRSPRAIAISILAALLPLSSYIYVYLRGALNPNWWGRGHWATPQEWFWSFVSTAQGRDELGWAFEPGRPFWGNGFPEGIWQELSLPMLVLGLVGIAHLPRRHAIVIYGTLLLYALFCWLYRFGNWFQVILPAYPLILVGLAPLYRLLAELPAQRGMVGRTIGVGALALAVLWRVDSSLPATDSRARSEDTALDRAALLLAAPLPHDARLFAAVDDALALNYLTQIWGVRSEIMTVSSRAADSNLADSNPIYVTVDALPTLVDEVTTPTHRDGVNPDWLVLLPVDALTTTETIAFTPLYTITPDLRLASYSVQPTPSGIGSAHPFTPSLDVNLIWLLPNGVWPSDLAISLRPLRAGAPMLDANTGQPIQQDRPRPLYGLWTDRPIAASDARPVVIHDPYRLSQSIALESRADALLLILYTQRNGTFTNIAEITLPLPPP
jgi:hypothetical protein